VRNRQPIIVWVARYWYVAAPIAITVAFLAEYAFRSAKDLLDTITVLPGDPWVYMDRWEDIRSGLIPYVETEFEHFPLTLVPIILAGLVADFTGITYWHTFAGATAIMVFAITYAVHRTGVHLKDDTAVLRFLLLITPLLPLVLFRSDILPLLCVAFTMLALVSGREGGAIAGTVAGILAKGWPVVFVVPDWWRGRRLRAVLLTLFCLAVVLALAFLPGFQSGREFTGIQQETMVGSILQIVRLSTGDDLGIEPDAGSIYLVAEPWMVAANVMFGALLGIWALLGLRSPFTWRRGFVMSAALTLALLIASPLLSPQFLVWPTAFLAIVAGRRIMWSFVAMCLVTTLYVGLWDNDTMWWSSLLLIRNIMLVVITVMVVRSAAAGQERTF